MNRFFAWAIAVIFISASCNKNSHPSGDYAQCKVNGLMYTPDNCANCIVCRIIRDTIFTFGLNSGIENTGLGLLDPSGIKVKSYLLNSSYQNQGSYSNAIGTSNVFLTDINHIGSLEITFLDKVNKRIEGTFSFTAYNFLQNKIVTVSEGEFRLPYDTN